MILLFVSRNRSLINSHISTFRKQCDLCDFQSDLPCLCSHLPPLFLKWSESFHIKGIRKSDIFNLALHGTWLPSLSILKIYKNQNAIHVFLIHSGFYFIKNVFQFVWLLHQFEIYFFFLSFTSQRLMVTFQLYWRPSIQYFRHKRTPKQNHRCSVSQLDSFLTRKNPMSLVGLEPTAVRGK